MEQRQTDIAIIGAGIIGLASAHYLARGGRRVVVIDQRRADASTAMGSCGTITPSHAVPLAMPGQIGQVLKYFFKKDAPFYVKPAWDRRLLSWLYGFAARCNAEDALNAARAKAQLLTSGLVELRQLIERENLACEFEAGGTLYAYASRATFEKDDALFEMLKQVDIPIQRLNAAACLAKSPLLRPRIVGGFFHPADASLNPAAYLEGLSRAAQQAGVVLLEDCPVRGFTTDGDRIEAVVTERGEIQAREVVLAAGAWSSELAKQLSLHLPIQPGKGYSITFPAPGLRTLPLVLREKSVCVTAWASHLRLGSTMEFSGFDDSMNRIRLDALIAAAKDYLDLDWSLLAEKREWYGWRPMTYDDLPIIGRSPRWANLVLATGHGMLGVSLSAITARLVQEIVAHQTPSLDLNPYRPDRF